MINFQQNPNVVLFTVIWSITKKDILQKRNNHLDKDLTIWLKDPLLYHDWLRYLN